MCIIAPSVLEADYLELRKQLKMMEDSGVKYLHIDLMDGNYVPNISFGLRMIACIRMAGSFVLDVHMMVQEPVRFADALYVAGADIVTVHFDACRDPEYTLKKIKSLNMKAGIVLNPEDTLEILSGEILQEADVIQLMSVEPGIPNQKFREDTIEKIEALRVMIYYANGRAVIEVDGGINFANAGKVINAGADIIVSGKTLFNGDFCSNYFKMKQIIM